MPDQPPRQDRDDVRETIDRDSAVDEASFESFPASDPPAYSGGIVTSDDMAVDEEPGRGPDPDRPDGEG